MVGDGVHVSILVQVRLLAEIVASAVWREPARPAHSPNPGDGHLWELLSACKGSVLVTGDRLLLDNPPDLASVLSPRSFLELLDS
jgi:predicted nucleic acid-binding protein